MWFCVPTLLIWVASQTRFRHRTPLECGFYQRLGAINIPLLRSEETFLREPLQHVYPDGRAERIQDGVMRARFRDGFDRPSLLKPGKAYKYDIDLWFTSLVIPAGHRLRVVVASAAFPKYDRNLNTGGDNERDTRYVVVHQRILHDKAHPSFVRLPIIPR
jgi:putative CocE/NonD family hydrolase